MCDYLTNNLLALEIIGLFTLKSCDFEMPFCKNHGLFTGRQQAGQQDSFGKVTFEKLCKCAMYFQLPLYSYP